MAGVVSVRDPHHRWDPKRQRPELWHLLNARLKPGESIRVFPLSNWTELDVWLYIYLENIPIVPLYFAKPRPVVRREGALDDLKRKGARPKYIYTIPTVQNPTATIMPTSPPPESAPSATPAPAEAS